MSLKQQARYRYSWKKPWGFDTLDQMNKQITEREVYRKIGLLERHSRLKKPYRNTSSHPVGELLYSPKLPPPWQVDPYDVEIPPPGQVLPIPGKDCSMACLGGALDCKTGGCDFATCICGIPPYSGAILEDPTGNAWIEGGPILKVCISGSSSGEEYGEVVVRVTDKIGQTYITSHPLVDCRTCCTAGTITGSATTTKPGTWTGTVSPVCPPSQYEIDVACEGDCTDITVALNVAGNQISAVMGDDACGRFRVKMTCAAEDWEVYGPWVRITNAGYWNQDESADCNNSQSNCTVYDILDTQVDGYCFRIGFRGCNCDECVSCGGYCQEFQDTKCSGGSLYCVATVDACLWECEQSADPCGGGVCSTECLDLN